jgi:hypothetical protein
MTTTEYDIRLHTERFQFDRGADFSQLHRIGVIVNRSYDVYDMLDNVADVS